MLELSVFFGLAVVMLIVFAIVIPKTMKPSDKRYDEKDQVANHEDH